MGTAQQQAALALPSAIVLEADSARPWAQAGEDRRTQGLLTREPAPERSAWWVWFFVLPFSRYSYHIGLPLNHLPAGQPFTSTPHSVPQDKGPVLHNLQLPPLTLRDRSCLIQCSAAPYPESFFLMNPPGKSFLLHSPHLLLPQGYSEQNTRK